MAAGSSQLCRQCSFCSARYSYGFHLLCPKFDTLPCQDGENFFLLMCIILILCSQQGACSSRCDRYVCILFTAFPEYHLKNKKLWIVSFSWKIFNQMTIAVFLTKWQWMPLCLFSYNAFWKRFERAVNGIAELMYTYLWAGLDSSTEVERHTNCEVQH